MNTDIAIFYLFIGYFVVGEFIFGTLLGHGRNHKYWWED